MMTDTKTIRAKFTLTDVPAFPFHDARVWLLVASAGCGKTYTIERTIDNLISSGVRPDEIMYILYNRKPADEFKAKFSRKGISDEEMRWWGTHHGIARRLLNIPIEKILRGEKLKKWGAERGFDFNPRKENADSLLDETEPTAWDEIHASLDKKLYDGTDDFTTHERKLLDALRLSEDVDGHHTDTRYLIKALRLNLVPSGIRYVFVDEGQDNGRVQFDYFRYLLSIPSIEGFMMAGDDKQAINAYKGGSAKLFLSFEADRHVCLPKTYRCAPRILLSMNNIIEPVKERSPVTTESARQESGDALDIDDFDSVIMDIARYSKERRTVLVLARNRCFVKIAYAKLMAAGIPLRSKWITRMRDTVTALYAIHKTGLIHPHTLHTIIPDGLNGELLKKPFWKRGAVKRLIEGKFGDDYDAMEAYDRLLHGGLPIDHAESIGFRPFFIESAKKYNFPEKVWNAEPEQISYFQNVFRTCGKDWEPVDYSTIHGAKGGEADVVVLLRNITSSVEETEINDTDEERRVWYVAASRPRQTLIYTRLWGKFCDLTTEIV